MIVSCIDKLIDMLFREHHIGLHPNRSAMTDPDQSDQQGNKTRSGEKENPAGWVIKDTGVERNCEHPPYSGCIPGHTDTATDAKVTQGEPDGDEKS